MNQYAVIILLLISSSLYSQESFQWEKVDSVGKTKEQIYTDTKIFIANTWKSAQNVIQNDDKDGGVIIVRGSSTHKIMHYLNYYTYVYSYTVTFKMKDNKYKISIDNVFCDKAYPVGQANFNICKIEPFDYVYEKCKTGFNVSTLPEKKAIQIMEQLRTELLLIYYGYESFINSPTKTEDW